MTRRLAHDDNDGSHSYEARQVAIRFIRFAYYFDTASDEIKVASIFEKNGNHDARMPCTVIVLIMRQ